MTEFKLGSTRGAPSGEKTVGRLTKPGTASKQSRLGTLHTAVKSRSASYSATFEHFAYRCVWPGFTTVGTPRGLPRWFRLTRTRSSRTPSCFKQGHGHESKVCLPAKRAAYWEPLRPLLVYALWPIKADRGKSLPIKAVADRGRLLADQSRSRPGYCGCGLPSLSHASDA